MFILFLSVNFVFADDITNETFLNDSNSNTIVDNSDNDILDEEYVSFDDENYDNYVKDNNIVNYDDEYLMDDMEYILEENNSIKKIYALNSNSNSISYNISNIKIAGNYVFNYIDTNKRLPAVVNIEEHNVNMNDFLYLMCKSLNSTNKAQIDHLLHT